MVEDCLYPLKCGVQHYDWGGRADNGKKPYIAELLGAEPDNKPYAELWIGAHSRMPSTVMLPKRELSLPELIANEPENVLGKPLLAKGVRTLPFMLKVLDCKSNLSIQAHPDKKLAEQLHTEDPEHYPDDNHKPEIAISICGMEAFCQFRPAEEVSENIKRLDTLAAAFADFLSTESIVNDSVEWLREVYKRFFAMPEKEVERLLDDLISELGRKNSHELSDRWFLELSRKNPGDRGALNAYFLNIIYLEEGESVFLAANEPHAYLRGTIIECMANSDNVVRAGLTGKYVDRETLVDMLTFRGRKPEKKRGIRKGRGKRVYKVPVPEFQVEVYTGGESSVSSYRSDDMISLMLVLDGSARFSAAGQIINAPAGSAWLWPAALSECDFLFNTGNARIVRARPNPDFFLTDKVVE